MTALPNMVLSEKDIEMGWYCRKCAKINKQDEKCSDCHNSFKTSSKNKHVKDCLMHMITMHYESPHKASEISVCRSPDISDQGGSGTCYAHATAHAVLETEKRIIGREPFCLTHKELVSTIIKKYGENGAKTYTVLRWLCGAYWLSLNDSSSVSKPRDIKCAKIDSKNVAWDVVRNKKRVIVGTFWLDGNQWNRLSAAFKTKPDCVFEKCDLEGNSSSSSEAGGGHAVCITGAGITKTEKRYWVIKNSWGEQFADRGFFRFSLDMPLKYYDVYFRICDLGKGDKFNYKLVKNLQTFSKITNVPQRRNAIENELGKINRCIIL